MYKKMVEKIPHGHHIFRKLDEIGMDTTVFKFTETGTIKEKESFRGCIGPWFLFLESGNLFKITLDQEKSTVTNKVPICVGHRIGPWNEQHTEAEVINPPYL